MNLEKQIFLQELPGETNQDINNCKKLLKYHSIHLRDTESSVGVLLGSILIVGFGIVLRMIIGLYAPKWLVTLVLVLSLLFSVILIICVFGLMRHNHRMKKVNIKIHQLIDQLDNESNRLEDQSRLFAHAQRNGWDYPLTPAKPMTQQLHSLTKRSYKQIDSDTLSDIMGIGALTFAILWTLISSLALCNRFSLFDRLPTWIVIVGILLSGVVEGFAIYKAFDEIASTFVMILSFFAGIATIIVYILIALLIAALVALIGSIFGWIASVWPILLIIGVIIVITRYF